MRLEHGESKKEQSRNGSRLQPRERGIESNHRDSYHRLRFFFFMPIFLFPLFIDTTIRHLNRWKTARKIYFSTSPFRAILILFANSSLPKRTKLRAKNRRKSRVTYYKSRANAFVKRIEESYQVHSPFYLDSNGFEIFRSKTRGIPPSLHLRSSFVSNHGKMLNDVIVTVIASIDLPHRNSLAN